jgi:hypothetical protein
METNMTIDNLDFKNKVLKQYKANLDNVLSEFEGTDTKSKEIKRIAIEWTIDDFDFSEIIRQIVLDSFSKET